MISHWLRTIWQAEAILQRSMEKETLSTEEPEEFRLKRIKKFVSSSGMKSKRSKGFAFLFILGKNTDSLLFFEEKD